MYSLEELDALINIWKQSLLSDAIAAREEYEYTEHPAKEEDGHQFGLPGKGLPGMTYLENVPVV